MVIIFFKVKAYLIKQQCITIVRYYRNPRFALYDLLIGLSSLFFNPYRICRKFLQKKGQPQVHGYGETPFTTFSQLVKAAELRTNDHYVELGSGRGKTCVWAGLFSGCHVTGIEWLPLFFNLSQRLSFILNIPVKFELKSFYDIDLSTATVVYLYSTQLSEMELKKIPFHQMPRGSRLITISAPHPFFPVIQQFPVLYPWGETVAYIQKVN